MVPNFTTNGLLINDHLISLLEGKVGAIAISLNDINLITESNLASLIETDIKTNIHFILSKSSIRQAIDILKGKYDTQLAGLNGLIFLTYKPVGRAMPNDCLIIDADFKEFISLIDQKIRRLRLGFDACFVPPLLHFTQTEAKYIDSCECAFFSVYIDEDLNVKPCSFIQDQVNSYNLRHYTFAQIWEEKFAQYRVDNRNDCKRNCKNKNHCRGKCPYFSQINFCYSKSEKEVVKL